jgi:hypothetical protein
MKKIVLIILLQCIGILLWGCGALTTATTVTTTAPIDTAIYEIATAADLAAMEMNKNYLLTADINLGGTEWTPKGDGTTPYFGTFDGAGHTISNYVITNQTGNFIGLFGSVSGTIQNLFVTDFSISVSTEFLAYVGGLVGYVSGNLTDCTVSGTIAITHATANVYVGLLAGFSTAKITSTMIASEFAENVISECVATGEITVEGERFLYVGGLIGKTYNTEVTRCAAETTLGVTSSANRAYVGGLIGHNYGGILIGHEAELSRSTQIKIEYSTAVTTMSIFSNGTQTSAGGLIGYDQSGWINAVYAVSQISLSGNNFNAGGLTGEAWNDTIQNAVASSHMWAPNSVLSYRVSGIAVQKQAATILNSYFKLTTDLTVLDTTGTPVTAVTLALADWYVTTLTWDGEIIDIPLAASLLSPGGE